MGQCHTQLDLLFIDKGKVAVDVKLSGKLGCSDCEIVRPKTLRGAEEDKYQNTPWALGTVTSAYPEAGKWDTVEGSLETQGAWESHHVLENSLLHMPDCS